MHSSVPIGAVLLAACCVLPAAGQNAGLFDELAVLYPDSQPGSGAQSYAGDTPRGVPVGVHLLVTGLPAEAEVGWQVKLDGATADNVRAFRLVDVPVEQNTGSISRTEAWDNKQNPHVIREAPFRVFEVLEPAGEIVRASAAGVLALRVEVPIKPDAEPAPRVYKITLKAGDWQQILTWRLHVHAAAVPATGPQSPGYTNWFSPDIIAERHQLEPWREPFWEMLGRYADLMARARQNTFWVRWRDFAHVDQEGKIVLNRARLQRYVRLFLERGFTHVEGGHLAHRHAGDWSGPRLDLVLTGNDVNASAGRVELAALLGAVRAALTELDLPKHVVYLQHLTDEPTDANAKSYAALANQVRQHLPGVKIFEATMSLRLTESVDHWCPQVQEYQKHREFFEQRQQAGDAVWVYTCLAPGGPWLNRLLDQERLRPVYLGWALVKYDLEGFLHWGLNHYRPGVDPLAQSVVPHGEGPPNFLPAGDSHLIYPGKTGPLSGQRCEAQRIGMEDAELLRLLKASDAERAEALIARVFRAFDDYEQDIAAYRAARLALLKALSGPVEDKSASEGPPVEIRYAFDDPDEAGAFAVTAGGDGARKGVEPKIADGRLCLLESWWKFATSAAFAAPTSKTARVVDVSWKLVINTGTEGAGFAWLNVQQHGERGAAPQVEQWEAPGIAASFGVGFDASNPVNRDPFRGSGNVYDRPQHELSLHWDGREIVKRTTPMDFRDEQPHQVRVRLEFVPGGADVSVWIDDTAIYERYFISGLTAYVGRPAFGGRNSQTAGDVLIDDLQVRCTDPIPAPEPPVTIMAIDHQLNDVKHPKHEAVVEFPEQGERFARIICTLRLDKPETRFDPWDRLAAVYVYDDDGKHFELLRYITPYHRGHEWRVDVTDFRPLLCGKRKIEQVCQTQGEGWVVTVTFDFYPGACERVAYRVVELWSGSPEIGNPEKPVADFYAPRTVTLDEHTVGAQVRTVVTGHGMHPNTNNAAEFMPLGRTLVVNGESFRNVLWKTDNYLNPCRPQGGTWKYDRAGWAPGDVVRPWEVDITHLLRGARELLVEYRLDPYLNEGRGETWAPFHKTEAYVVFYRAP
ncbi:MAG: DUF4091 domain-containing protein [Planctomycetes bacterium]|nr:DUF4091 domain-containing protein [Planctomycetota bacterium]